MKNLKLTTLFTVIIALLFSFTSCKKDKGNGPDNGGSTYQFANKTYNITSADEKHIAGDIYLAMYAGPGDILQIGLANTNTLPEGTLTFNADRNAGYNPQTNFWASSVSVGGVSTEVTGGTVTVTKSADSYKVVFNATTANGTITGEYNGTPQVTN